MVGEFIHSSFFLQQIRFPYQIAAKRHITIQTIKHPPGTRGRVTPSLLIFQTERPQLNASPFQTQASDPARPPQADQVKLIDPLSLCENNVIIYNHKSIIKSSTLYSKCTTQKLGLFITSASLKAVAGGLMLRLSIISSTVFYSSFGFTVRFSSSCF